MATLGTNPAVYGHVCRALTHAHNTPDGRPMTSWHYFVPADGEAVTHAYKLFGSPGSFPIPMPRDTFGGCEIYAAVPSSFTLRPFLSCIRNRPAHIYRNACLWHFQSNVSSRGLVQFSPTDLRSKAKAFQTAVGSLTRVYLQVCRRTIP